jgi:hypothetical protein
VNQLQPAKRIIAVRACVAKLADRGHESDASSQRLAGEGSDAADAVVAASCTFHDQRAIGTTLGVEAGSRSAQILDAALIGPFRDDREFSGDELAKLRRALEFLRIAARTEMQSF